MGLLDDAIREHLDLKRRRGADPTEVERAEREALGPVRRAPESAPGDDEVAHEPVAFESEVSEVGPEAELVPEAYEDAPAAGIAAPPLREPAFDQESDSWSYEDVQSEAEVAPPPPPPARAEPPLADPDDDPFAEPPAAPPQAPPHQAGTTGGETVEYDVEAALDAEPPHEHAGSTEPAKGPDGEDVLEETPEFLQDTPDHDRLWFEQRPPKDFDFDG
jgi:hypothetical protein